MSPSPTAVFHETIVISSARVAGADTAVWTIGSPTPARHRAIDTLSRAPAGVNQKTVREFGRESGSTVQGVSTTSRAHEEVNAGTRKRKRKKQQRHPAPEWRVETFKFVPLE
jgi:hypothetical protein